MAISSRFVCQHRWSGLPRRLLMGIVMAGVAASTSACGGQGSATGAPQNSPVKLDVSSLYVTVENQAGLPLTNVSISIVPFGVGGAFTSFSPRMESAEKRNIMLGDFRGQDGTPFSLRAAKPKTIRIEASDVAGKKYSVEYPWTQ